MGEWVAAIGGAIGIITPIVTAFLFRKENKKIKGAEADKAQAEASKAEADLTTMAAREWKDIAENREEKLKKKEEIITQLYKTISEWRDNYNAVNDELHALKVELIKDKITHCEVERCPDRKPKTGF